MEELLVKMLNANVLSKAVHHLPLVARKNSLEMTFYNRRKTKVKIGNAKASKI